MKFYCVNLGCKVNAYETRAVATLLLKEGYTSGNKDDFDVAIINTCTITHVASAKSRQHIRKIKNMNKNAIVIAMGCYANNNANEIIKECDADIVIGINHRKEIANLIKEFIKNKQKIIKVDDVKYLRNEIKYEELGQSIYNESTRAYVKISDGCDNFCSYCIIPITRGRVRSRDKDEILCEIKQLLDLGYKEIVLTGIDTSSYGKEFKNYNFSSLLEEILSTFPNLFRLRISSIEISEIDDKFLSLLKKYNNIANHLHIPLQSGCDATLKRMNRKYNTNEYLSKINKIREIRKDIAITTDVIVGFPLEDDKEFIATYNFIKKVNFMMLHVFPFSKRKGTAAYLLKDNPSEVKKARVDKLLKLSNNLHQKYINSFIGKELDVLFLKGNEGITSNYLKVKGLAKPNEVQKIKIAKSNVE